jgi:hypothetical protein
MNLKKIQAKQQQLVNNWNNKHTGGASVVVTLDNGEERPTKTKSQAWMLGANSQGIGGHTAVILLEGISGAYALDRVREA